MAYRLRGLARRNSQWRIISALDMVTLLDNLYRAYKEPDIGWSDTTITLPKFVSRINTACRIEDKYLEKALWACNMLDEKKKFKHYGGLSFDQFIRRVVKFGHFDKQYNYLSRSKKKE